MSPVTPPKATHPAHWPGIIERYRSYLPVTPQTPVITLLEGNTPLIPARFLAAHIGVEASIYFKFEGLNPTGSFKDRGMTMAVSKAVEKGAKAVLCASTGNTSASAAAYAARAGISCIVLIPQGYIAAGKMAQALIHGAKVVPIEGNFDSALVLAKSITTSHPITLVNSVNPDRLQGQKSAAYEIVDALGDAPDVHCIPVGNAGNITAYWMGYNDYRADGHAQRLPHMWGFQAAKAAPIVDGHVIDQPETVATAIRIGNPASWKPALEARDASKGAIEKVSDEEILAAYQFLASREGVFCEPASAASVAGLIKYGKQRLKNGQTVICTLTGHGLKDPDTATKVRPLPAPVKAEPEAVLRAMGF